MSIFINRQEAIDALYEKWSNAWFDGEGYKIADICEDVLLELPSTEILQCKDCKHWHNAPTTDGYNSCEKDALIRHESFFCADAKLRGDSDEE